MKKKKWKKITRGWKEQIVSQEELLKGDNWQKRRQAAKSIIIYLPYEKICAICGCCKKLIKMVAYVALFASEVITSFSSVYDAIKKYE